MMISNGKNPLVSIKGMVNCQNSRDKGWSSIQSCNQVRGEAGKGGWWVKGAINHILIMRCCMKY